MPSVLIIVVTYEAEQWLETCLGAVRAMGALADLAVVDNNSKDKTRERLATEYRDLITHYFPLAENVGFGRAHNLVFSQPFVKAYNYYLLLNQDAEIDRSALLNLIALADRHTTYGVISPLHYRNEENLDIAFAGYYQGDPKGRNLPDLMPVSMVNAAIWLLRKSVVEDIGYFNPVFPHYAEDVNYLTRIHLAGYRVGIATGVRGYHYRTSAPPPDRLLQTPYRFWTIGLLRMVDPRLSTLRALIQTVYDYFRLCSQLILSGKWKLTLAHLGYLFRIIKAVPTYGANRKIRIFHTGLNDQATINP